jgi:very-short-patch-repair endonuclease
MPARDGSMHRIPPYLVELARNMRREPTTPETWLWTCLRARQLGGAKFRRQRPLGRYIADFCCDEARLVIELDGEIHRTQVEYDTTRDGTLAAAGYRVLRIANRTVVNDPELVLLRISEAVIAGLNPADSDSSSPLEGEEAG